MKVLIADDDPQFVEILSHHLKKQNILFDVANTASEVQTYAGHTQYDLILHDVFLPNKEDGLRSLKTLKTNPLTKKIPVVLITSMPMDLFNQEPDLDMYLAYAEVLLSKGDDISAIVKKAIEIINPQF